MNAFEPAGSAVAGRRSRRTRLAVLARFICGLFLLSALPALRGPIVAGPPQETRRAETVAPGVEHIEIKRGDFTAGGGADHWTINVLVLDPAKTRLAIGRARDRGVGTEMTSSMAARHAALAAVNGGYFRTEGPYRGEPACVVIMAGKVLSEPSRRRPGLAVSNAGPRTRMGVVDVSFRAEVVASTKARRRVDGVNRPRLDNELVVFTPEFNRTTLTGPDGIEAVVEKGRVRFVRDGAGDTEIPRDGWAVSAQGAAAGWVRTNVRRGARLEMKSNVRLSPRPAFIPEFVIGGGPRLVQNGRPAPAGDPESFSPGFADARHPRTAVGLRADGSVLLVTVDGRRPGTSVGMSIAELAALLVELGAVEAVNMDGGGSTTMAVYGRVVNNPSDLAGERPVGDALLVFLR